MKNKNLRDNFKKEHEIIWKTKEKRMKRWKGEKERRKMYIEWQFHLHLPRSSSKTHLFSGSVVGTVQILI